MTFLRKKSKLVISLAILLLVCVGLLIYFTGVSADAVSITIGAETLFPRDEVDLDGWDQENSTFDIRIEKEKGLVLGSAIAHQENADSIFTYKYFKNIKLFGLEGENLFEMEIDLSSLKTDHNKNSEVRIMLKIDEKNLVSWKFSQGAGRSLQVEMVSTEGENTYGSVVETFSDSSVKIGVLATEDAGEFGSIYFQGKSGAGRLYELKTNIFKEFDATLVFRHTKRGNTEEEGRVLSTTIESLCGNSFIEGNSQKGIKDTATPSIALDVKGENDEDVFGGTGTDGDPIKLYYAGSGLLVSVSEVYDIFADSSDMIFSVSDVFLSDYSGTPINQTRLFVREPFVDGEFLYNPKDLYGNILAVGRHRLSISMQKLNGMVFVVDIYVKVVASSEHELDPSPTIVMPANIDQDIEFFSKVVIEGFSAKDVIGRPATSIEVTVKDKDDRKIDLTSSMGKLSFTPQKLGEYTYEFKARDSFGLVKIETVTLNCVKNTSPTAKADTVATKAGQVENAIYYKEDASKYLLSPSEAAQALFDDVDLETLLVEIKVETRDREGVATLVANSHSFVPTENATYFIVYTAKDVAFSEENKNEHIASVEFALTVKNKIDAAVFDFEGNDHGVVKIAFCYPSGLYPEGGIVMPDLGNFVRDFDSLNNKNHFVGKLTTEMVLLGDAVSHDEYKPNGRIFAPSQEGTYRLTYTVKNSAGHDTSISFDIVVSAYVPKFDETKFKAFVEKMSDRIALNKEKDISAILQLPQVTVFDGYKDGNAGKAYEVVFDYKIFDSTGADVTSLVQDGKLTPSITGMYKIKYTATNIMGKTAEATWQFQVYVPTPEIINPENFQFVDTVAFSKDYKGGGHNLPMMKTSDLNGVVVDYYGIERLTISLEVRKQDGNGNMVVVQKGDEGEYKLTDANRNILFMPNQKGSYIFDFILKNDGGGTVRISYIVNVSARAPEENHAQVAKFREDLNKIAPIFTFKEYDNDKKIVKLPKFDIKSLILDTEGDNWANVKVTSVSIIRPNGIEAKREGESSETGEYSGGEDGISFKPQSQGTYVLRYKITNDSGEFLVLEFMLQVFSPAPEIKNFEEFRNNKVIVKEFFYSKTDNTVGIPFLDNEYVVDNYAVLSYEYKLVLRVTEPNSDKTDYVMTQGNKQTIVFSTVGEYLFEYIVTNEGGKATSRTFVIYVSAQPDSLSFVGETQWGKSLQRNVEIQVPQGTLKDYLGNFKTAKVEVFGPNKNVIEIKDNKFKPSTVGDYFFTYSGDSFSQTFSISVKDTQKPVIVIYEQYDKKIYYAGLDRDVVLRGIGVGFSVTDDGEDLNTNITVEIFKDGIIINPKNSTITMEDKSAGVYLVVYTAVDVAQNVAIKTVTFTIISAPQIVLPIIPRSALGNTDFRIPLPIFIDSGNTCPIFCVITSPSGKIILNGVVTGDIDLRLEESSVIPDGQNIPYEIKFQTRIRTNDRDIESEWRILEVMSLDGGPVFDEGTMDAFSTELNRLRKGEVPGYPSGLVASVNTYFLPEIKASNTFEDFDLYAIMIKVEYFFAGAEHEYKYYPKNGRYELFFKDEAIYHMSFLPVYRKGDKFYEITDQSDVTFRTDSVRVSGDGGLMFEYKDIVINGFQDEIFGGSYAENIKDKTLFVLPANGRKDITLVSLAGFGSLNGVKKALPINIYVYGPGKPLEDNIFIQTMIMKNNSVSFTATKIGQYTFVYEIIDDLKNTKRIEYQIVIKDEIPPVFERIDDFSKLFSANTKSAEAKKVLVLPTPQVSDNCDSVDSISIEVTIVEPNGNRYIISGFSFVPSMDGKHTAIYTIWDSSGKSTMQTFEFTVVPEVPPTTPILGIAVGGIVGLTVMAGLVYLIVFKNIFRIKKLIPKKA